MKRRLWMPALAALLLLVFATAASMIWRGVRGLDRPLPLTANVVYRVAPGVSLARLAQDLSARGILAEPKAWVLFARFKGLATSLRAGEYAIGPVDTPRGLLDRMVKGDVLLHAFTIVDGWRVRDLLAALRRDPYVVTTLPTAPADLMRRLGAPGSPAEGQFLPETYEFPDRTTDVAVLNLAHRALVRELASAWKNRDPDLPLRSAEDLLIVASIVQKESALPEERRKIAGLYLHRLQIGMRLQADPTIIYGLGDRYDGTLHTVDLRTDGPYNTYTRAGLPPTPIALAGAAAITASAHPEKTDALFFVASGKADGSHVFSATLRGQNAAVDRYLAKKRKETRKGAVK